jgi:hypothetical protein
MSTTLPEKATGQQASARPHPVGAWNRRVGWVSAAVGAGTGLIMGLWSFGGPAPVPAWLGEYGDLSRRLARLGHIAFFGLGILDILLAQELCRSALGRKAKQTASIAMIIGNIGLPLTLFAAAACEPLKYLMSVPACSVFVALAILAYGVFLVPGNGGPPHDDVA